MGRTSKDKRDIYYRLAKSNGWRARSAYKLLQINEEYKIFDGVKRVVDLCAAPGSWSQVLAVEIYARNQKTQTADEVCIVAVDLQPMAPLPGVIQLKGDITDEATANAVIEKFHGEKADLVVCDGAPDVTGLHTFDEFLQSQLILAAFNISTFLLRPEGTFVSKIFLAGDGALLKCQMDLFFRNVQFFKPQSSRLSSAESFLVCRGFKLPEGYVPSLENPVNMPDYDAAVAAMNPVNRVLTPFISCGDLSGFDSERTWPLDLGNANIPQQLREKFNITDEWKNLLPVQPPTEPAYKHALELKRNNQLDQPEEWNLFSRKGKSNELSEDFAGRCQIRRETDL